MERDQPHVRLPAIRPLAEKIADRICEIRSDLPARFFKTGGCGIQPLQARTQGGGASLRSLLNRGDSLQILGWLAFGIFSGAGLQGLACRSRMTKFSVACPFNSLYLLCQRKSMDQETSRPLYEVYPEVAAAIDHETRRQHEGLE